MESLLTLSRRLPAGRTGCNSVAYLLCYIFKPEKEGLPCDYGPLCTTKARLITPLSQRFETIR